MYTTVERVQLHPGKRDHGVALWNEQILPALRKQPGFKGAWVLHDPHTHKGMRMTRWESEAACHAAYASAAVKAAFDAHHAAVLTGERVREGYEVVFSVDA